MKVHPSYLAAALAMVAVAGCGQQQPTQGSASEPAGNLSGSSPDQVSDIAPEKDGELASAVAPDDVAKAAPNPHEADPREEGRGDKAFDPKNSQFTIDGSKIVLKNGLSQVAAAPGSASMVTTRYTGEQAAGDLNGDGRNDLAYFVTREGPGSGRFTYVVAAISGANGFKPTNAFLVGDRIAPQSLAIGANELRVSFSGRDDGEPMTALPTRPSLLLLKVTPGGRLQGLMK
jgi:hypothetical protein